LPIVAPKINAVPVKEEDGFICDVSDKNVHRHGKLPLAQTALTRDKPFPGPKEIRPQVGFFLTRRNDNCVLNSQTVKDNSRAELIKS
jgi:hypothetical protein